jgi:NAD(P)-dependent dehydrogenase (short-subunit alcohol dehydrogenase family)
VVAEQLGGIDIIVYVVGGSSAPAGGFAVIDDDQWSKELNPNLMAAVRISLATYLCRPAQEGGRMDVAR